MNTLENIICLAQADGGDGNSGYGLVLLASLLIVGLGTLMFFFSRFKRCPSDRILVIYGKTGKDGSSRCIHGLSLIHI